MAQQELDAGALPRDATEAARPPLEAVALHQWYALGVLTILNMFNFLDRGGLTLMVGPIKADLGVTDTQMGLLLGMSYAVVHNVLAIPGGYLADIFSRRVLIGGSVLIWSCMSAATGFAGSYWQLFAGRTGLGIGEAAMTPAGHSIIQDMFPAERRGRAFSIYSMGAVVAAGLSLLLSGMLIRLSGAGYFASWPIINHFKTWQIVIAFPGICTIPFAFLMITVREPARRLTLGLKTSRPAFTDIFRYIRDHIWVMAPFFGAAAAYSLGAEGFGQWMPTALMRGWGLAPATVAHTFGLISLSASLAGLAFNGYMMDFLAKRGYTDSPVRMAIFSLSVAAVCNLLALHMTATNWVFGFIAAGRFFGAAWFSVIATTLAVITPSRLMGRMTALLFMALSLFGAPGSAFIAMISDHLFSGPLALIPAMSWYYAAMMIVAMGCFVVSAGRIQRFHRLYAGGV